MNFDGRDREPDPGSRSRPIPEAVRRAIDGVASWVHTELGLVVSGVRTFGFYNAGQDCTAACRLYVGPKIYDKLVADLTSAVSSIKTGLQTTDGVEMGPLISAEQRKRVAGFVERAKRQKHIEVASGHPVHRA